MPSLASTAHVVASIPAALALLACGGDDSGWERSTNFSDTTLDVAYTDGDGVVWAGGRTGTLLRYDAGVFVPVDTGSLRSVRAIHGAEPGQLWVAGDDGLLLQQDGDGFIEREPPIDDHIEALWVFSSDDIVVTTTTRAFRGAPGAWNELELDGTYDLIWAFSPDDVWLIQSLGDFAHWDGTSWQDEDPGLPGVSLWYDVTGHDGELWAVGSNAGNDADWVLHLRDGEWDVERIDWLDEVHPSSGITVTDSGELYRVGSFGFTAKQASGQWSTLEPADDLDVLIDVVTTDDEVIAVGEQGVIWRMPR